MPDDTTAASDVERRSGQRPSTSAGTGTARAAHRTMRSVNTMPDHERVAELAWPELFAELYADGRFATWWDGIGVSARSRIVQAFHRSLASILRRSYSDARLDALEEAARTVGQFSQTLDGYEACLAAAAAIRKLKEET